MVTIRTRYVGPRGLRGARIVATGQGRQATVPYPHELPMGEEVHAYAARVLADRLGLGTFTSSPTANPSRWVHTVGGA